MDITNQNSVWTRVSDEIHDKTYGPEGEYGLEELRKDVENEFNTGYVGDEDAALEVYEKLEQKAIHDGRITGEDIEDMKSVRTLLGD